MATPFDNVRGLKLVTAPAVEPITLPQAKNHLRVDISDDDPLIEGLIIAAREACEAFIHGCLITQTWRVSLDAFPDGRTDPIQIPVEPLQSVVSVEWFDQTNTGTTLNPWSNGVGDYIVDLDAEPGRLVLPPNQVWPGVSLWPVSPVQITVTAGFGADGINVPRSYIAGMLMCIASWYENRSAVETTGAVPKEVPMGAENCWWSGGRYWHLK